jgi:hypothetical protein
MMSLSETCNTHLQSHQGVSAAYSVLGAARIVGSVFARIIGSNSFLHFGKAGLRVGGVFGVGGSIVGGNLFLDFGKAGLFMGVLAAYSALGAALLVAGVVTGNFFLYFWKASTPNFVLI